MIDLKDDLHWARLLCERAVLRRLDQGYLHASGGIKEVYFANGETRERIGLDPLRPQGTHAKALEEVQEQLSSFKRGQSAAAEIAATFSLDELARDIVTLCFASRLDADVARLLGSLGGETPATLAEILQVEATEVLAAISRDAPAVQYNLLSGSETSVLSTVSASQRLLQWLLGDRSMPAAVATFARVAEDGGVTYAREVVERLTSLAQVAAQSEESIVVMFHGPIGSGKRAAASDLAKRLGKALFVTKTESVWQSGAPLQTVGNVLAECMFQDAIPLFDRIEHIGDEPLNSAFFEWIDRHPGIVFLSTAEPTPPPVPVSRPLHMVTLGQSPLAQRKQCWRDALASIDNHELADDAAERLAARYVIGPSIIRDVVDEATRFANSEKRPTRQADIDRAVGRRMTLRLGAYGDLITRSAALGDMVLPEDVKDSILDMIAMVHKRSTILEEWGLGAHLALSRGVSALFSGKPGTGKTMAASVISSELGIDLVRIDLSAVVSKWVGETEKHLAKIFDEAQTANAMLLFDEADSLFGKRTDVSSAQDRYANLEVNYILQRMESFDGISVLTTNFETTIDQAFLRRLNFRIRFPEPEIEERELLWRQLLPKEAGVDADAVDFNRLARTFEMTGGHIKNAIVRAAVFAARHDRTMTGRDLLEGAHQEYQEMGKLMAKIDY